MGYIQQSTIRLGGYDTYPRAHQMDGYVQDEWNVRKNLTLNIGVRYDYASPYTEKYGRMVNLDVAPGFTAVAPVLPGGTGPYNGKFPDGLLNSDFNKFSPRLGIAYRPGTKRRTVIRSGFSLFYDNSIYGRIPGRLTAQPPFAETSTFITAPDNVLNLQDPFTGPPNVTVTNTYAVDKNLRTPYATTWSLSLEHELPGSLVASATYIGTKGTHLDVSLWPNRLTSSTTTTTSNASGYTYDTTVGNSIFNALQFRLNRRLRRGLNWTAYYQWAKSIDDATTIGGAGSTVIQNANDIEADRGPSSFDRRHTFTFSTMAVSPFGPRGLYMKRGDTFVSKLLSDWSATANLTLETGTPLTATVLGTSADPSGTGAIGSGRADATGLPINSGSGPFNLLAFTVPPQGQYGTAGRNTIPGPGMISLNATFGRTIQFGDSARRSLDIRLTANNVLNHVNITSWGTVVNSANYGLPCWSRRDAHAFAFHASEVLGPMRRSISLLLVIGFLAVWGLVVLPAQQTPAPAATGAKDEGIPVFKSSSNLVLVTVYVKGKDGKPVPGLKAEDFTIVEKRKQQAISVFEFQSLNDDSAPVQAEKKLEVRASPEPAAAPDARPRETALRFKDRRLLVLYIDWTSMDPAQQLRAKEGAEKAVREQLGPSDLMAVLSFGTSVVVDQELTSDKDLLLAALERAYAGPIAGHGSGH